jgi:hypothetical protein
VLEAASGSTRVRETGLRRARLSAHPSARIALIIALYRRKAKPSFRAFATFRRRKRGEREPSVSRARAELIPRAERNPSVGGLTVETDAFKPEKESFS